MNATKTQTQNKQSYYKYALFDKDNQAHRYILSLAHQLGWTTTHPKFGEVADLNRLGRFIATRTPAKKLLKDQTPEELKKTIYALERVIVK